MKSGRRKAKRNCTPIFYCPHGVCTLVSGLIILILLYICTRLEQLHRQTADGVAICWGGLQINKGRGLVPVVHLRDDGFTWRQPCSLVFSLMWTWPWSCVSRYVSTSHTHTHTHRRLLSSVSRRALEAQLLQSNEHPAARRQLLRRSPAKGSRASGRNGWFLAWQEMCMHLKQLLLPQTEKVLKNPNPKDDCKATLKPWERAYGPEYKVKVHNPSWPTRMTEWSLNTEDKQTNLLCSRVPGNVGRQPTPWDRSTLPLVRGLHSDPLPRSRAWGEHAGARAESPDAQPLPGTGHAVRKVCTRGEMGWGWAVPLWPSSRNEHPV